MITLLLTARTLNLLYTTFQSNPCLRVKIALAIVNAALIRQIYLLFAIIVTAIIIKRGARCACAGQLPGQGPGQRTLVTRCLRATTVPATGGARGRIRCAQVGNH